jgi:H+/Na+-translocating ferredoxin:NAD+ oxidoreductase subunit G
VSTQAHCAVPTAPASPGTPPPPAAETSVTSFRLVATLTLAGMIAGLLMALLFSWAQPRIMAEQQRRTEAALQEVLKAPARVQPLYVYHGRVVRALPAGADTAGVARIYEGFDAAGRPIGFGIGGTGPGFADAIGLIFGYDPRTGQVLGMKVLESKETPGLADKITYDTSFIAGFARAAAPLVGVKHGRETGDRHEVDMISGATISSTAVIRIINRRVEELGPVLAAYLKETAR